jgi:hypothetical protein
MSKARGQAGTNLDCINSAVNPIDLGHGIRESPFVKCICVHAYASDQSTIYIKSDEDLLHCREFFLACGSDPAAGTSRSGDTNSLELGTLLLALKTYSQAPE